MDFKNVLSVNEAKKCIQVCIKLLQFTDFPLAEEAVNCNEFSNNPNFI